MNKFSSILISLCLMCTGSLAFAVDSMDKDGAMENGSMSKDVMKKKPMKMENTMMKAQPKKMQKQDDKMEHGNDMENISNVSMEPKK